MGSENGAKSLGEILDGKEFIIPLYQRNYKWNTDVATKLVQDIVECFKQSGKTGKSIGLLTLYKDISADKNESYYESYYVIDGQQRFTTLAILLGLLKYSFKIHLSFERDDICDRKRRRELFGQKNLNKECTDINRIRRNRDAMRKVLEEKNIEGEKKDELADYIFNNVIMLCSVVSELPVEEFMNLNAYKTAFSISDLVRANLISLNSFYRKKMEDSNICPILARCLSKHSYKTAVAILYNNLQLKLYKEKKEEEGEKKKEEKEKDKDKYSSIYELLKEPEEIILDPQKESHINILFGGMLPKGAENYFFGDITKNFDEWIQILLKLAHINSLLDELKEEMDQGEFHSFKQIDDYQKLIKKSFIREVFGEIRKEQEEYALTLAKEIQKYTNITSVLIRCLKEDEKKLANRYLEAFVYSTANRETNENDDKEDKLKLPQMSTTEVIEEISGCGRYIIDRYEREHREDLNVTVSIPPVLDLEDRENLNFGGSLNTVEDEITVGELFKYDIKIPVIQRDYCMGARITGENDFLSFLLKGFNEYKPLMASMKGSNEYKLMASTILLSVTNDNKTLYIFDGQQRTYTLYNILKYCGEKELKSYTFVGRIYEDSNQDIPDGSPYSKKAVKNLKDILDKKITTDQEKAEFKDYIKSNVRVKVKVVTDVSGAEQFFMDINGGIALKKYEIYKAVLCDKLSSLKMISMIRKIENEWLDYFYAYRKEYLGVGEKIKDDQEDEEELLEIRFIEYVCRLVYKRNHSAEGNGNAEEIIMFDEIDSKGELVANLGYIDSMTKDDMADVEKIMDAICQRKEVFDKKSPLYDPLVNQGGHFEKKRQEIDTNSKGDKVWVCLIKPKNDSVIIRDVLQNQNYYIARFIWSLSDTFRGYIKNYYRYEKIASLRKIYDDDHIIKDILLEKISGNVETDEKYPYTKMIDQEVYLYGGYHNKLSGNKDESENKDEPLICKHPEKEAPVYYLPTLYKVEIIRLQYLIEIGKDDKPLHFALVEPDEDSIKYEDNTPSKVFQIEEGIEYWDYGGEHRFKMKSDEDWQIATKISAYLFKKRALGYIEKIRNNIK